LQQTLDVDQKKGEELSEIEQKVAMAIRGKCGASAQINDLREGENWDFVFKVLHCGMDNVPTMEVCDEIEGVDSGNTEQNVNFSVKRKVPDS
jgi:hypothetical protein